jgi:PAS domain S-box-containing protein
MRFVDTLFHPDLTTASLEVSNLVEDLPGALLVVVKENCAYINRAGVRLFGANSAKELLDSPVLERIAPECRSMLQEKLAFTANHATAVSQFNVKILRIDQSSFHGEVTLSPTRYAGKEGVVILLHDITEQVISRQATERYRIFSENVPNIMWFVRFSDAVILEANHAAEEAYGYTQEEFIGLPIGKIRADESPNAFIAQLERSPNQGITF